MRRLGIPLVHPHPQDTPHLRHLQGTVSIDCYLLQAYGTVDAMCALELKHYGNERCSDLC